MGIMLLIPPVVIALGLWQGEIYGKEAAAYGAVWLLGLGLFVFGNGVWMIAGIVVSVLLAIVMLYKIYGDQLWKMRG
jgi:hypothetical protein